MEYNITYRQKDRGWQFIISYKDENGKWKQKSKQGFKKKSEAKPVAEKMLEEIKNKVALEVPEEFEGVTFKEFTDLFLKHAKVTLEQNTVNGYETILLKFKELNNMDMTKIKPVHIQNIVDGMANINKEGTIKTYIQRLHSLFKVAVEQYNIIPKNPVSNIKYKSNIATRERKALNVKESDDLLSKIKNRNYYTITLIALESGLRIGEIIGLTWDDIDFRNKTININKQWKVINVNGVYGFGSVKSKKSNRVVPMSKSVYAALNDYKIRNLNGRIFNYKNTSAISSDLRRLYIKLGYKITIHELRHTFATNDIADGMDFKTVAKLMGHDVGQTMKTYSHVTDEMLDRAFELIKNR
jgi:integrase